MLLVYDDTGFVEHAVFVGDFAALKAVNEASGKGAVEVPYQANPMRLYVRDGEAIERPLVGLAGEVRDIKADGDDALQFLVTPKAFSLVVRFAGIEVHRQDTDTGMLEFAATVPGTYELEFAAAFPHWPTTVTIEVYA